MKYIKPPLPFMGNKKNQLKHINEVLDNMYYDGLITKDTIFYDVFGGSGLVSHFIKQKFRDNRVIWNDFDNYKARLDIIDITESIRDRCAKEIIKADKKQDLLTESTKARIQEILSEYREDELDCITLSTYFLFAGHYAKTKDELIAKVKYNRMAFGSLNAKWYLDGVERVQIDAIDLLKSIEKERESGKAFLVLDPPYLQTISGNYAASFTLKQFLEMIELITKPFILFSNKKSDILPFIEFFRKYDKKQIFDNYTFDKSFNSMGSDDYMIYTSLRKGLFENGIINTRDKIIETINE